jgi:8-oxo-dGTP pyrophosphatase MutT (NUDIX family)
MLTITTDSLAGPGGVVNSGETPEDAIVREAVQEYGLDVTICSVRDSKVLAETNDRLLDGSFWRRKWYLLQLTDTKQVPRVCPSFAAQKPFFIEPSR